MIQLSKDQLLELLKVAYNEGYCDGENNTVADWKDSESYGIPEEMVKLGFDETINQYVKGDGNTVQLKFNIDPELSEIALSYFEKCWINGRV